MGGAAVLGLALLLVTVRASPAVLVGALALSALLVLFVSEVPQPPARAASAARTASLRGIVMRGRRGIMQGC